VTVLCSCTGWGQAREQASSPAYSHLYPANSTLFLKVLQAHPYEIPSSLVTPFLDALNCRDHPLRAYY
jgi:hypothetical protein